VPVFIFAYFNDERDIKIYAILIYAVAGLSDFLDGYLARRLQAQSKLGKLLDPLGDKLMTFAALVCITITINMPIFIWAVLVVAVKEIMLGIGGLVLHKMANVELPAANILGKTSTVLFFLVCGVLMLFKDIKEIIVIALVSALILLTLVALAGYLAKYISIMKNRDKPDQAG